MDKENIFRELAEISRQYLAEVPSRRKTWPRSMRERIVQLRQLQVRYEDISKVSGVPLATLYSWARRAPKAVQIDESAFKELAVTRTAGITTTCKATTVTVVVSNIRIEIADPVLAARFVRELGVLG